MRTFFNVWIICFCPILFASDSTSIVKSRVVVVNNGNERTMEIIFPNIKNDLKMLQYYEHHAQANPFIRYPFTVINDTVTSNKRILYSSVYHTGKLGLRVTNNSNPDATKHLLFSGDSNVFGIGSSDNDTLPNRIDLKIKSHTFFII